MKEELPIGSKIGEVQAIDEDEGDNAVIDYAIIGKSSYLDTNKTGQDQFQNRLKSLKCCSSSSTA